MGGLVVKPRARILHGHDWVFRGEVLKVFGSPADGDVISLKDGRDRLLGSAIYNSRSQIVARRFSRRKQELDLDFFQRRIAQAVEYRARRGIEPRLCRLVWSESDGLPGVVVDRYGDCLVLQTLTLAMDQRKELIVRALEDHFCRAGAKGDEVGGAPALQIIERHDAAVRRAEGMELQSGLLRGNAPNEIEIEVAGLKLQIDPLHGQKTGFYLDQLPNYALVAEHARGRRVSIALRTRERSGSPAPGRPREVVGVEAGAESARAAEQNSARNQLPVRWIDQDVFQFLRGAENRRNIRPDHPRSAVLYKEQRWLARRFARLQELHVRAFNLAFPLTECWRRFLLASRRRRDLKR